MPKLSLALATTVLTISLVSTVGAYETEPTFTLTQAALTVSQPEQDGEICVQPITPELTAALALPSLIKDARNSVFACVGD